MSGSNGDTDRQESIAWLREEFKRLQESGALDPLPPPPPDPNAPSLEEVWKRHKEVVAQLRLMRESGRE
jgi:hypothetical protein